MKLTLHIEKEAGSVVRVSVASVDGASAEGTVPLLSDQYTPADCTQAMVELDVPADAYVSVGYSVEPQA